MYLRSVVLYSYCKLALSANVPENPALRPCGDAFYLPTQYTCFDQSFLCPIIKGSPTRKCGLDCYLPDEYSCEDSHLKQLSAHPGCNTSLSVLQLLSPPYSNYFLSDCHSASQVVITSPLPTDNLTIISPRLLVAWPAGNSGVVTYFAPQNGINGTLAIAAQNSSIGSPLGALYDLPSDAATADVNGNATVGVSFRVNFSSAARLEVAILGSIRTIRDFSEGPSLLRPEIQSAIKAQQDAGGGVSLSRLWLDNTTTTTLKFMPASKNVAAITIINGSLLFAAGDYDISASFNYPQLTPVTPEEVLSPGSQGLINSMPMQTSALSFLSYASKLTAGGWRFLTYFGRDTMIAALLLQPILSGGQGGALEAVIAGVLERLDRLDGSVCHEETIGDYATWLNLQNNISSTAPQCSYIMIDTDYYLPVLMNNYFLQSETGQARAESFFSTHASTLPINSNLTYSDLALLNAERIMALAAPFAGTNNHTIANLIHLKPQEIVGQWRDSTYGIGGGRVPFDVNAALVPAALRSIAALSHAGFFPTHPEWQQTADAFAQTWEDETLALFEVRLPAAEARSRVNAYTTQAGFPGADQTSLIDSDVVFHALALEGNNGLQQVEVLHSDVCFRLFLVNSTNDAQLTAFLNATANSVQRTFPAGLMTDVGMLVANPAFGGEAVYAANWTTSAYHGTVVWSWPLAMMAKGLELQLARCVSRAAAPAFCADESVHQNVKRAYNVLWDRIEANSAYLTTEVWSWTYADDAFRFIELGALPPPAGQSPTESNIVQLWSLTFLAVKRNLAL